jgi:hypothetical protein
VHLGAKLHKKNGMAERLPHFLAHRSGFPSKKCRIFASLLQGRALRLHLLRTLHEGLIINAK